MPKQTLQMHTGGGRAQGGDCIVDASLRQRHHVHITFDHQNTVSFFDPCPRAMQIIQLRAFVKYRCFRRVQVFWIAGLFVGFTKHSATKAHHAPSVIVDWEHDPMTKTIVDPLFVVLGQHAGIQ